MSEHTPGPVESLARLCLQSDRYRDDPEFRDAVDSVLRSPVYDAAPDLLEICEWAAEDLEDGHWANMKEAARQAVAKARGLNDIS